MKISIDYSRRKSDMSFFSGDGLLAPQSIGFNKAPPKRIAGKLKASQNYVRIFLTPKGEKKESPLMGTDFAQKIVGSTTAYPIQVIQLFYLSNLDVLNFLKSTYTAETPEDEKVVSAELLDYQVGSPTAINLTISITTGTGEKNTFLLPVDL